MLFLSLYTFIIDNSFICTAAHYELNEARINIKTDIQTEIQTDIQTGIHTDIQTDIQTEIQTDIQTGIHTDIQTGIQTNKVRRQSRDLLKFTYRLQF